MKQNPEVPIAIPIPMPEPNGKAKAIEVLEKQVFELDKRLRTMEMGECQLGKSHDEEIKKMRERLHGLSNQVMIFLGQRQAISWLPAAIQTAVMVAGFWLLYVHGSGGAKP